MLLAALHTPRQGLCAGGCDGTGVAECHAAVAGRGVPELVAEVPSTNILERKHQETDYKRKITVQQATPLKGPLRVSGKRTKSRSSLAAPGQHCLHIHCLVGAVLEAGVRAYCNRQAGKELPFRCSGGAGAGGWPLEHPLAAAAEASPAPAGTFVSAILSPPSGASRPGTQQLPAPVDGRDV